MVRKMLKKIELTINFLLSGRIIEALTGKTGLMQDKGNQNNKRQSKKPSKYKRKQ
jgi:hypothetical protein